MPTDQHVRTTNFIVHPLAIVTTLFRLFDRTRRHKQSWDDAWAAFALIADILLMVFIELMETGSSSISLSTKVVIYYGANAAFYAVVWSARLSILNTIIRLCLPGTCRNLLRLASFLFVGTFCLLLGQVFWVCETEPGWKQGSIVQCKLGYKVAIAQLITDIVSDLLLVLSPCWLIARVRFLTKSQKIRLIAVFSASASTSVVSISHAVFLFMGGGKPEVLTAVIEASASLIVANLSVLVGASFRLANRGETESDGTGEDGRSIARLANRFRSTATAMVLTLELTTGPANTGRNPRLSGVAVDVSAETEHIKEPSCL